MEHVVPLLHDWPFGLVVLLVFGLAPGALLRAIVVIYPKSHPRRAELVSELYRVPYWERPLFVAQQLETALFEGSAARWAALRVPPRLLVVRVLALMLCVVVLGMTIATLVTKSNVMAVATAIASGPMVGATLATVRIRRSREDATGD